MAKEMRKVCDYYYKKQWVFRIGYAQFLKARSPLPPHEHPQMTEFVYLERGTQTYRASGKDYLVKQGDVFFTFPNESHDTGSTPEERSSIYYLIIDLKQIPLLHLFVTPEEYDLLQPYYAENAEQSSRIFKASEKLPEALKQLLKSFAIKDLHYDTRVRNALSQVLLALTAPLDTMQQSPTHKIRHSLQYIENHLEEVIRVSDLPKLEHTSLSTYNKYFIQAMGQPPAEYILQQKIEKTKEQLLQTDLSVTEIACKYGFSSGQYFATVFKRYCNTTPSQFRLSNGKET